MMERWGWIPGHIEDVASDLSVLHRISDWRSMPGPVFLSLSERLVHYQGAMRDKALSYAAKSQEEGATPVDPIHDPRFAGDGQSFPDLFEVRHV